MTNNLEIKNFALIGLAGYIAPRHMRAIKDTGNNLVAALDPFDSVGIIDSFFPEADFFTETERFDRHLDKLRRGKKNMVDYVSICSPNYLHDAHIRLALRNGANAICEKPLLLNPWNIDGLEEIEIESGKKINNILQLRHHPVIIDLKDKYGNNPSKKKHDIKLTYITSRGKWYYYSWKGEAQIGRYSNQYRNTFFRYAGMDIWENSKKSSAFNAENKAGLLELEDANVSWYLSLDRNDLPDSAKENNLPTFRSISIDNTELEFSGGFTDLHTLSYQQILAGKGYGINDARQSIEIAHEIRNQQISNNSFDYHPL